MPETKRFPGRLDPRTIVLRPDQLARLIALAYSNGVADEQFEASGGTGNADPEDVAWYASRSSDAGMRLYFAAETLLGPVHRDTVFDIAQLPEPQAPHIPAGTTPDAALDAPDAALDVNMPTGEEW